MTVLLRGALLALQAAGGGWQEAPPLPRPVVDPAVAAVETAGGPAVVAFPGRASPDPGGEPWERAFRWVVGSDSWSEIAPPPGPHRRRAAVQSVAGRVYLFGGYGVGSDGLSTSLDRVDVYDPATDAWSEGATLPVAVGDAVSGVWRDSLVYLVGGRHDGAPVNLVQLYDPATDGWTRATPLAGSPVAGHAGGVARDAIVYLGGLSERNAAGAVEPASEGGGGPRSVVDASSWRGDIHPGDPSRITWRPLPPHPGPARYRAAATSVGTRIVFVGGSEGPWELGGPGSGPDRPAPVLGALVHDLVTGSWSRAPGPPEPTVGHGDLVRIGGWLMLAGGATGEWTASGRVWRIPVLDMVTGGR